MKIPAYHIDAFAGEGYSGNPAMVCLLERWLDDEALQRVARENDLPVTAFLVGGGGQYELRWFTPAIELNLCGHGTIAAGEAGFDFLETSREIMTFKTRGGSFDVSREGSLIGMDFPLYEAVPCSIKPENLVRALGREPREILKARNYLAVYEAPAEIRAIAPDMDLLKDVDSLGVIVTSKGEGSDFVSRYFAPKIGIPEDAATGSTHCTLAPYWSARLGKRKLHAVQLSQRGGELWCESLGDRVRISAKAVLRSANVLDLP